MPSLPGVETRDKIELSNKVSQLRAGGNKGV
jgi:hypothetical protein